MNDEIFAFIKLLINNYIKKKREKEKFIDFCFLIYSVI